MSSEDASNNSKGEEQAEEEEEAADLIGLLDAIAVGKATWYDQVQRGGKGGRLVLSEKRLAFYANDESNCASEFKVCWNFIAKHLTSLADPQKPMLKLVSHKNKALKFTMKDVGDLERIKADVRDRLVAVKMREESDTASTSRTNSHSVSSAGHIKDPLRYLQSLIIPEKVGGLGEVVTVSVVKDKFSVVGLVLGHSPQDRKQRLCIAKIAYNSLLQDTALRQGMEVLFINGNDCQDGIMTAKAAAKTIKQTSGQLVIVARTLPKTSIQNGSTQRSLSTNAQQPSRRFQLGMM